MAVVTAGFVDRWVKRLSGTEPITPQTTADYQKEYDAELARARADTPALPKVKLPPYSAAGGCPKCGSAGLTTTFFDGVHEDCPEVYLASPPYFGISFFGMSSPRTVVARERQREAAVEHLDRRCCNCKYGWAEGTVEKPAKKATRSRKAPVAA